MLLTESGQRLATLILVTFLVILTLTTATADQQQATITVTGTVTGTGSVPIAGATVGAWLPTDEGDSTITNAAGFYELTLPPGDIAIHVRPPLASSLAERYIHVGYRDTSFTQDFEVVAGHLVAGIVRLPNGDPPDTENWVVFDPMSFSLSDGEWLGAAAAPGSGEFQAVAPVGVYWVGVTPPVPYYPTHQTIDLTSGDATGVVLTLDDEPTNPIPYEPPDATRMAIGLLLRASSGGETIYRANTITIQGEQVFVGSSFIDLPNKTYLPLILQDYL